MSYKAEARSHIVLFLFALGMLLLAVYYGLLWTAIPTAFSVGWSGAIAWMLTVRNMRPAAQQGENHHAEIQS